MTMPKEISDAILAVMKEVGYVQKTGENKFHGYKYASIENVLEKVQPALVKCGLAIVQSEVSYNVIGDRDLVAANYDFFLSSGGATAGPYRITGLASMRNTKGGFDDKCLNKCHTAARKYFILGLFQIPTGVDADEDDDKPAGKPADNSRQPDRSQAARAFVTESIKAIGSLKTETALDDWYAENAPKLARLKESYADEAKMIAGALAEQRKALVRVAAE